MPSIQKVMTRKTKIVSHSGGVLGREISQQPDVVLDGTALTLPSSCRATHRPDFRTIRSSHDQPCCNDTREATLTYTRLIALNALDRI